jgi:DNA-binding PadR family transcriptional regulator
VPRRKHGQLIAIEVEILLESLRGTTELDAEFHGFAMAKRLRAGDGSAGLIGHGTLYKALGRLDDAGLLESRWEDSATAEAAGRPRRRLYRITSAGRLAVARALEVAPNVDPPWSRGIAPA